MEKLGSFVASLVLNMERQGGHNLHYKFFLSHYPLGWGGSAMGTPPLPCMGLGPWQVRGTPKHSLHVGSSESGLSYA